MLLSGLGPYEHLSVIYWCHDQPGFGLQLVVCLWELVLRYETPHLAGYGQDHEGESSLPCLVRADLKRSSAVFFRANQTVLEQSGI